MKGATLPHKHNQVVHFCHLTVFAKQFKLEQKNFTLIIVELIVSDERANYVSLLTVISFPWPALGAERKASSVGCLYISFHKKTKKTFKIEFEYNTIQVSKYILILLIRI